MMSLRTYTKATNQAVLLLSELIRTPSISGQEDQTAGIIDAYLSGKGIQVERSNNNVFARNHGFDSSKPTVLLNSHHDTVRANSGYEKDPFEPTTEDGKLFGLGSNDAGGCLVSLIQTFLHFYERELPFNIIIALTAEEETSGTLGVESILNDLGPLQFAIVGEPTLMKMAVAEKGLMVLDCCARGEAAHVAHNKGVNAIYESLNDIEWFRTFQFEKESDLLGPVKMSVTAIHSGDQHNVLPDACHFVVDVRTIDKYTNQEILDIIRHHVHCEVKARSTRLESSFLPSDMMIAQVADDLGIEKYGSPTTSDQAVMPFPSFKMGPGNSERSHIADEFIYMHEIEEGITGYINLLEELVKSINSTL